MGEHLETATGERVARWKRWRRRPNVQQPCRTSVREMSERRRRNLLPSKSNSHCNRRKRSST